MHSSPFCHTFSIVARDSQTGAMGVAVQSHWFSVGSVVTWAEAGVGAIATQALAEVSYGPLGLDLLKSGKSAQDVLSGLLLMDEQRDMRQVAIVDVKGEAANHTGVKCMADAGHEKGDGFSVQANMMLNNQVWPAMARAYQSSPGDLAERMLAALAAGQAAGGDIRGQQSAAILIVEGKSSGKPWADRVFDLRVEDHPSPIVELHRLVQTQRAYHFMNKGDEYMGLNQVAKALDAYRSAAELAPHIDEIPFWQAVTMADSGMIDAAIPLFRHVFQMNPNWAKLLQRLPPAGMIHIDQSTIQQIIDQAFN